MKLLVRDTNPAVVARVADVFSDVKSVKTENCTIFLGSPQADAIISPANSSGRMNGGIDLVYLYRFGIGLEERLRNEIASNHQGYLPVGYALAIETRNLDVPWLICAPTMSWPPGDVRWTQNAYLAFAAALRLAKQKGFESLLSPGLCTLTGKMHPMDAAIQMRKAWDEVIG